MKRALYDNYAVFGTDISQGRNFLTWNTTRRFDAIITNPPYSLADAFIKRALELTEPQRGVVAMLVQTDFDHAATRQHLISEHPAFTLKLALTKRIRWFEKRDGDKSPSYNHAWLVWDWMNTSPPTIRHTQ
jgi:16S rRNA A1518/A1519 N6-dimethyltransferase RsmA/KsgA/DIM1 with predicted DNA glycosylase/AP lyase activity